jgi:transcriptional regulator with PAS, ATPase and Fis domain
LTPHPIITAEDLPETIRTTTMQDQAKAHGWDTLEDLERSYILRVLEAHHQDHGQAAAVLGIHRKTLLRKLRQYGQV